MTPTMKYVHFYDQVLIYSILRNDPSQVWILARSWYILWSLAPASSTDSDIETISLSFGHSYRTHHQSRYKLGLTRQACPGKPGVYRTADVPDVSLTIMSVQEPDIAPIREWRSILTLIVFIITSACSSFVNLVWRCDCFAFSWLSSVCVFCQMSSSSSPSKSPYLCLGMLTSASSACWSDYGSFLDGLPMQQGIVTKGSTGSESTFRLAPSRRP